MPFGFSGRAARVKNKEAALRCPSSQADNSPFAPGSLDATNGPALPGYETSLFARRSTITRSMVLARRSPAGIFERERFIDVLLQRHHCPTTKPAIGRDDHLRLGILDPVGHRLRAEPAENDRVDGSNSRARQHGNGGFGHHRQINNDPVALLDAMALSTLAKRQTS